MKGAISWRVKDNLASKLRLDYVNGVESEKIWDEINAELEIIFPVRVNLDYYFPTNLTNGRAERIASLSPAEIHFSCYRELQHFIWQVLEASYSPVIQLSHGEEQIRRDVEVFGQRLCLDLADRAQPVDGF